MAWRYTFDDGPERALDCNSSLYAVAAMSAFARENIQKMPTIQVPGIGREPFEGHILKLWDDKLLSHYGPLTYGLAFNQCGSLTITTLSNITSPNEKRPRSAMSCVRPAARSARHGRIRPRVPAI